MANASNTSANRYKGNDIDTDGDGRVGKADHASNASNADAVGGNYPLVHGTDVDAPGDAHHARPIPGEGITENADGSWDVSGGAELHTDSATYYANDSGTHTTLNVSDIHPVGAFIRVEANNTGWSYNSFAEIYVTYADGRTENVSASQSHEYGGMAFESFGGDALVAFDQPIDTIEFDYSVPDGSGDEQGDFDWRVLTV